VHALDRVGNWSPCCCGQCDFSDENTARVPYHRHMGKLYDPSRLREKANRLALDAHQKPAEQIEEARRRLEAGRATLTGLLENPTSAQGIADRARSGGSPTVGKLTQTLVHLAPALERERGEIASVVSQLDAASAKLARGAPVREAAAPVERAMTQLLDRAGVAADAMPRNLLEDLVAADAAHAAAPEAKPEPDEPATAAAPPAPTRGRPANPLGKLVEQATSRVERHTAQITSAVQSPLSEIARPTDMLSKFNPPALVDRAMPSQLTAPAARGESAGRRDLMSLLGGGLDLGPVSIGRDGIALEGELGRGTTASVNVGRDGTVTGELSTEVAGGTASLGAELGPDGRSVNAGFTKETPLGEVTASIDVDDDGTLSGELALETEGGTTVSVGAELGADGATVSAELSQSTPVGDISLAGEYGPEGVSVVARTPLGDRTLVGAEPAEHEAADEDALESEGEEPGPAGTASAEPLAAASAIPLAAAPARSLDAPRVQPLARASATPAAATRRATGGGKRFDTARAVRVAGSDNASSGYCAKGVANVLADQGFPVQRGNATDWWRSLPRLGWRKVDGVSPATAPEGAVLVFTNNRQAGRPVTRRRGGQLYGHVEIVGLMPGGRRVYISDAVRSNFGGTVPNNFKGAYVYGDASPDLRVANATPTQAATGRAPIDPSAERGAGQTDTASTAAGAQQVAAGGGGRRFDSARGIRTAQTDNARAGFCAKGVANVLEAQGFPVQRGNATDWWKHLPRLGWSLLPGVGPSDAPEGAVLVFTNNAQAGRPVTRRRGGQLYGHVEIVGFTAEGRRVYISDAVRNNFGGTVPNNFKGAYVYGAAAPAPLVARASTEARGSEAPELEAEDSAELGAGKADGASTAAGAQHVAVGGGRRFDSARGIRTAQTDSARAGYCAKGVANVLEAQGFPVQRGNATDWWKHLPRLGWSLLPGVGPTDAPEGAVLVFTNNAQAGRPVTRRRGGQLYGHVEIVGFTAEGRRVYISDAVRNNFGGTVPNNFKGAYVYGAAAPAPLVASASTEARGSEAPELEAEDSAELGAGTADGASTAAGARHVAGGGGRHFDSARGIRTAQTDNARAGFCAKGVANVLEAQGFPVQRGNATDWWKHLPRLGWSLLPGVGPTDAPEGAVLVFTNNAQAGRPVTRRRGGQLYGHVEIVGFTAEGRRVYISDAVRNNFGGTVPNNFRGAYVYGTAAPAPAPLVAQAPTAAADAAAGSTPAREPTPT
jgi:hypothetical protein